MDKNDRFVALGEDRVGQSATGTAPSPREDLLAAGSRLVELNDTDGDLGLHALIDGEAWRRLSITDPNGRQILLVRAQRRLARQGLTELFFESDEPEFEELSPEEFFDRFPEGRYAISGLTIEGDELESTARFRHVMPAPADGIVVSGTAIDPDATDCDEAVPVVVAGDPFLISWDPVTDSHPDVGRDGAVVISNYQFVVEREEPTLLVFSVDLPPDVTEVEVPAGFLALGDEFKFEILARERAATRPRSKAASRWNSAAARLVQAPARGPTATSRDGASRARRRPHPS